MPNLITHLKKVAEQKPQATYYNVDMLKYQVSGVSDRLDEPRWYCCSKLCVLELYAGVMWRASVSSSEPGSELEMWTHQHWSEDRLQV